MKNKKSVIRNLIAAMAIIILVLPTTGKAQSNTSVPMKLYTLDGGHLAFKNMGIFYDTGEHEGEPGEMAVPCYLIQHGKDWVLWDTGNGDEIAAQKDGVTKMGILFSVRKTLAEQLAQLGLKPSHIKYVILSHLHPDHTGNVKLFPNAKFIVATPEMKWAFSTPTPEGVELNLISTLKKARVRSSDDDVDLFGDGTIKVLRAPGHTPGHRILLIKLANTGNILITGDLFHTRENYEKGQVDAGNYSRADELASFDRFRRLKDHLKARVIIQHSPEDFAAMPVFPKYLE